MKKIVLACLSACILTSTASNCLAIKQSHQYSIEEIKNKYAILAELISPYEEAI